MTAWGKMTSQFEGHCVWCDCLWPAGAEIAYIVGEKGYYCSNKCLQYALAFKQPSGDISTPPTPDIAVNATETRLEGLREAISLAEQVSIYAVGYRDGFRDGRKAV